jgi:hypothetical protein
VCSHATIGLLEQCAGSRDLPGEELAGRSQLEHRASRDELDADLPLQRGDVLGHGGLAEVQPVGGSDERAFLSEGEESAETASVKCTSTA